MSARRRRQAGISLIEALVALAVMAFGMLGVVGMQATLRTSADLSRQNAEAVRLAQEEMERLRNYAVLLPADAGAGQLAFGSIASAPASEVATENSNTEYLREVVVGPIEAEDPLVRHVTVTVSWTDRLGQDRRVVLNSLIAGVPPELGALPAMRSDRGALAQPSGRHAAIPPGAVRNDDGVTSTFTPPGAPAGTRWIFNNTTGVITSICTSALPASCTTTRRLALSGTVAFATGGEPTSGEAENPTDAAVAFTMVVDPSLPAAAPDESCFLDTTVANRRPYFCAVPTSPIFAFPVWSGQVKFAGSLATSVADSSSTTYKVCRYTPDAVNRTTPAAGQSAFDFNARHPFAYSLVTEPLANKNFLIISSGNGAGTAFTCPTDDSDTSVRGDTFIHQPAT